MDAAQRVQFLEWVARPLGEELVREWLDEEPDATEERLSRRLYKETSCGAWLKLTPEGLWIGTIVEGSDAERSDLIPWTQLAPIGRAPATLDRYAGLYAQQLLDAVVEELEGWADAEWNSANGARDL